MKTMYEVWSTGFIARYTKLKDAERLVYEHPLLTLTIREQEEPWFKWFLYKIAFQ